MAEPDIAPLPTLKQVCKTYRLSPADAQAKLDQLTKERNAMLAQRAQQQAEAQRNATEAARVQAEAEAKRAAAAAEAERIRQAGAAAAAQRQAEAERLRQEQERYDYEHSWPVQAKNYGMAIGAPLAGAVVGERMGHRDLPAHQAAATARAQQLSELMKGSSKLSPTSAADIAKAKARVAAADEMRLAAKGFGTAPYRTPLGLVGLGALSEVTAPYIFSDDTNQTLQKVFGRAEMGAGAGMALNALRGSSRMPDARKASDLAELSRLRGFPDEPLPPPPSPESTVPPEAPETPPKTPEAPKGKPKLAAADLEGKTASELKELYKTRNPGEKLPVAEAGVGGLKNALIKKLTTTGGIAGLAIGSTVYDAMRSPTQAEDGSVKEGASAPTAAAVSAGAGYGAYKGANAVERALQIAGEKSAPYIEKVLGPLAPYAGKAAGLIKGVAGKVATPLAVGQLAYSAAAPSDTASPEEESAAISGLSHPEDELRNITTSGIVSHGTPGVSVAAPETAQALNPGGYHDAVEDEHHLADQAISALQQKPEALDAILQRTHDIAQSKGWDPSAIGKIIGMKMQQPEGMGAQQ
jgi:hypothetical protein